jgi:hypothetical protein
MRFIRMKIGGSALRPSRTLITVCFHFYLAGSSRRSWLLWFSDDGLQRKESAEQTFKLRV